MRTPSIAPPTIRLHDDLTLTALGPTAQRLTESKQVWEEEVAEALEKGTLTEVSPGLEPLGPKVAPILEDIEDLREPAETDTLRDRSEANGSSIALLLEYKGRAVPLSGDAFAEDLIDGIAALFDYKTDCGSPYAGQSLEWHTDGD